MRKWLFLTLLSRTIITLVAAMPMAGPTEEAPAAEVTTMGAADMAAEAPAEAEAVPTEMSPAADMANSMQPAAPPAVEPEAPTPMPMPTETTPTAQPQPMAAPATPAAPSAANPHQQELTQINQMLQSIAQDKATLKTTLSSIDTKLEEAKAQALDAHKKSLEILNQPNEAAAKTILDQINQNLTALTATQKELEAGLFKEFDATDAKIKTSMQTIQTNISQLQAKGVAFKVAQAAAAPATEPAAGKQAAFKTWFVTEKKGPQEEHVAPTFIHYIFYKLADVVAGAFRVIYATWVAFKNALFGAPTVPVAPPVLPVAPAAQPATPTPPPEAQPSALPEQMPTMQTEPAAMPAEPAAVPMATTQAEEPTATLLATAGDSPAVAEQETKAKDDAHETIVMDLLQAQYKRQSQSHQLEQELEALMLTLASNPTVKKDIPSLDLIFIPSSTEPTWKKSIMGAVGMVIDAIIYTGQRIKFYLRYGYSTYVAPLFGKIKTDVEQKIQQPAAPVQAPATTPV